MLAGENTVFDHEYASQVTGEPQWFELIAMPRVVDGETGALVAHVPITARKDTEIRLRHSQEQLRLMADNFPLLICYLDGDQRFRFANRSFTGWLNKPLDELLGESASDIFSPAHYDLIRPLMDSAYKGEQTRDRGYVAFPDGTARYVVRRFIPHVADDGAIVGIFLFIQDITDFKAADEQLRRAQKMEALGQLATGIAHDFNNLLAVITGEAELLKRGIGDPAQHIEAMLTASDLGAKTAHQLLAFSRHHDFDPVASDINLLIADWTNLLSRTLGETVEIESRLERGTIRVMVDPVELKLALLNLAINARDAMPQGGKLVIETASVPRGGDARDRVMIAVIDTGVGIPPEVQEHVSEPFFTTKGPDDGSGLGLAAVQGFVTQSGGTMDIESAPGKGTTVRLYLPLAEAEPTQDVVDESEALPSVDGKVVLLIEDEHKVRSVTQQMLRALGYEVLEAESGVSALPVIEGESEIDLLLSDVVLPGGISGPAVAYSAKQLRRNIEVLFMSGHADAVLADHDLPEDADLIRKPFTMSELAHRVSAALHS